MAANPEHHLPQRWEFNGWDLRKQITSVGLPTLALVETKQMRGQVLLRQEQLCPNNYEEQGIEGENDEDIF